jgi:hypothetical protein
MRVNAPNATKKYPSYRKKLRSNLPTKKAENVKGLNPRSFSTVNAIL